MPQMTDDLEALPFWAQVLIASRLTRRSTHGLDVLTPQKDRDTLIAGCDAMDRCACAGSWSAAERDVILRAKNLSISGPAQKTLLAMYYAADATHAANDTMDFGAADAACMASVRKSISFASQSRGLNPLQAAIAVAGDMDIIAFACKEASIGRYDGLGEGVMSRIHPVHPPESWRGAPGV
ncbi:MAG: hypothetical protein H7210_03470 [Pyrinomonadaceae bacterium]|nr:hypothetical protein [Phycisphaerales bacterium]